MAADVGNNAVAGPEAGALIQSIVDTLNSLATDEPAASVELTPAVPIRRSVTDDTIVCLEDGKKLRMLKWHLMTDHGMTLGEYRARCTRPSARRSRSRSASAVSRPRRRPRPSQSRSAGARPRPDHWFGPTTHVIATPVRSAISAPVVMTCTAVRTVVRRTNWMLVPT